MSGTLTLDERIAALRSRIAQSEAAFERLMNGTAVKVVVDPGGERVEFVASRTGDLGAYIARLQAELNALLGAPLVHPMATRPISFVF